MDEADLKAIIDLVKKGEYVGLQRDKLQYILVDLRTSFKSTISMGMHLGRLLWDLLLLGWFNIATII